MEIQSVGVIGLGYVGLKEAMSISDAGIKVIGFDINKEKVEKLNSFKSVISTVSDKKISDYLKKGSIFTVNESDLSETDLIIIAVPTPLDENLNPERKYIISAVNTIEKIYSKQVVVLESTTYPGCTNEILGNVLKKKNINAKFGFCGERENPGSTFELNEIPRIIGANNEESLLVIRKFYERFIDEVHEVSTIETAEITKLYENVFRSVNIGLVNEFKGLCLKLDIDPFEVVNAADTKPFGFSPFFPGPGVGGHCIPIDPEYLYWVGMKKGYEMKFIKLSREINNRMPDFIIQTAKNQLIKKNKSINESKVLICGVSYKKDIEDTRESPAIKVVSLLKRQNADIVIYDPVVYKYSNKFCDIDIKDNLENIYSRFDFGIILTDHDSMNYELIQEKCELIFDSRNILPTSKKVIRC